MTAYDMITFVNYLLLQATATNVSELRSLAQRYRFEIINTRIFPGANFLVIQFKLLQS